MERLRLHYKNSVIGYYRFGTGPDPVVCFHGYGEEASIFGFLAKFAGHQYTFYSVDLPFHGSTEWKEGRGFSGSDLSQIIEEILQQNKPDRKNSEKKISILGFSLGGRAALSLYQEVPDKIGKLVLLAPDGLKVNFWYWLSTQTWAGARVFAITMKHPGWFFGFLKLLNKLRVVNTSIFKFVNYYIGDRQARLLLFRRWISLRKLKPDLRRVKFFIRQNNTVVRLVYGKHDRIMLSSVGEKFSRGLESQCTLSVIDSGHQVLNEKHAGEIVLSLRQ